MTEKLELTRRKILASVGGVGAAGAAAGMGTSALFSDEEQFENNSITAGTLDMAVKAEIVAANQYWEDQGIVGSMETADGDPVAGLQATDVKPGDWAIICFTIEVLENPGCVTITTENLTNYDNGGTEPEINEAGDTDTGDPGMGEGELQDKLVAEVWEDFDSSVDSENPEDYLMNRDPTTPAGTTLVDANNTYSTGVTVGGGTAFNSRQFYLLLELPADVGNVVQSDSVEWDLRFDAIQARNNPDCSLEPDDCTPECPSPTNPDPGTDDFDVTVENIDASGFPTIQATTRVETDAAGDGALEASNFSIDEETPNGIGSGFCGQTIDNLIGGSQGTAGADVMIVFDTSGSMDNPQSKIENAKEGAKTLVRGDTSDPNDDGLDSSVNIGLTEFESSATVVEPLGTAQSTIVNSIDALSAGGTTNMTAGIDTGQGEIDANGDSTTPDFMVVLANGGADDDADTLQAARDARNVTDLNDDGDGTTIISIAYGDGADENLMEDISSPPKTDDGTIDSNDENAFDGQSDDISDVFGDIGDIIAGTYTIEYETANCEEDGLDRNVKVYVDDPNEGDADETGSYTAPN